MVYKPFFSRFFFLLRFRLWLGCWRLFFRLASARTAPHIGGALRVREDDFHLAAFAALVIRHYRFAFFAAFFTKVGFWRVW